MRIYAIEVCNNWEHWHVARNVVEASLFIYIDKAEAIRKAEEFTALEKKRGYREFGIKYRVVPFTGKRVFMKKRKKSLK